MAELLGRAGYILGDNGLLGAVDAWRRERVSPMASVKALGAAVIAHFDALSAANLVPYLPPELARVPRANIDFLPIQDAWFSGLDELPRPGADAGRRPKYEASYEINASLQISLSRVPAAGQPRGRARPRDDLCVSAGPVCARKGWLRGHGAHHEHTRRHAVRRHRQQRDPDRARRDRGRAVPDEDLQIGVLLALLQDDAKNQSSYLTWGEGRAQKEVAATLRRDFLVTEERADKLSGAWGRHPLLGRMYLPAYRAGTDKVAQLRRTYPAERVLPAIYGCYGLVDIETIDQVLQG